jgi:hypothetical protein
MQFFRKQGDKRTGKTRYSEYNEAIQQRVYVENIRTNEREILRWENDSFRCPWISGWVDERETALGCASGGGW